MCKIFFSGGGRGETRCTTVHEKVLRCSLISLILSGGVVGMGMCVCVRGGGDDIQSGAVSRSDICNKRGHVQFSL